MITFQATHSLPNASFQSCPWAFVHASLHRQHPSFQSTVSPANAHSFSRTSPLPLECFLHPPLPGEAGHPCLCDLPCKDNSAPAPMTAGSKSMGRTSVHLCIPLLGPHKWTEGAPVFVDWRPMARSPATSYSGRVTAAPRGGLWREDQRRGSWSNSFFKSHCGAPTICCAE